MSAWVASVDQSMPAGSQVVTALSSGLRPRTTCTGCRPVESIKMTPVRSR